MSVLTDPQTRRSQFWMTAILVAVFLTITGATLLIPLLVTKDRNEEVIRSVGGSMISNTRGQNQLVSRFREKFLGQPSFKNVFMGPVDRSKRKWRQVYNEKLRDDDLLNLDVRSLGPQGSISRDRKSPTAVFPTWQRTPTLNF